MADPVRIPPLNKGTEASSKRLTLSCQADPCPMSTPKKTLKNVKSVVLEGEASGRVVVFLLKLAALEVVRRFSRRKCPVLWHVLQAMQVVTCPPLKWIQRWRPLKKLVEGMQVISRPLFLLSAATTLSAHPDGSKKNSPNCPDSRTSSDSQSSQVDTTRSVSDDTSESVDSDEKEKLLVQLRKEMEKQGIILPERITNDEIRRFRIASNGDFSCLLQTLKKTICWRESYQFLSQTELEKWSHLVFWHGCDMKLRPCLVIRLGLACSAVVPKDRPHFIHAIISQVEHSVLYFLNGDDPRITVLMDCQGLSPLRFPAQMLRSCSGLMQDHYPHHLANLLVVRLPPVTRVIAQAFIQVLKPTTRGKLRIEGELNHEVLAELFQSVPSFLGGNCKCSTCSLLPATKTQRLLQEVSEHETDGNGRVSQTSYRAIELPSDGYCVKRRVVGLLILFWVIIVLAHHLT